ncbi:MAG TPA: tRNA glutamyl-Q(34) synthetase GluQRS [Tepidisphaeraceae bacterium]|jgi:glutamyl-tRNA synthetase|nr:tRNA glutamyl-Q(34) synthetase GluQRS [Tepidisphaeraceae bacterium]
MSMPTTRLAPSPTGALHLGNARTFLVNWLIARQQGWTIILRVEDLDGPRIKQGAAAQAMDDLKWLGIDWDQGPIHQSARTARYSAAVQSLVERRLAYGCVCSRKEVEAASSAPHAEDGSAVYPGVCRGRFSSPAEAAIGAGKPVAIRFETPAGRVAFEDLFAGKQEFDVARDLGDFVVAKADGTAAYQLAVVVDDAEMGITHVVRGDDLLDSTPRQILLYQALGMGDRVPRYCHLPLVVGTDGRRLAKRHGDTRLAFYRERGVEVWRVLHLLARWCGIESGARGMSAGDLLDSFSLDRIPREPIVFSQDDDSWLRSP